MAGDYNGDGHLDLATAGYFSNIVSVSLGNGDGSFQQPVSYKVGPTQIQVIATGDYNGDGHLDLAAAAAFSPGGVSILLGIADGTFPQPQSYAVGSDPFFSAAGDFNGDGHLDLVTTNIVSQDVSVLLGNGDGTFQPSVSYAVAYPNFILTADYNGDGHPDLAVTSSGGIAVLLGNGDGTFQRPLLYVMGAGISFSRRLTSTATVILTSLSRAADRARRATVC